MLVEAQDLSRHYGRFRAVDRVNFRIDRGEIVGLLGPNGAGKTTTMRMLTCFLPPTSGTARIAGHDIVAEHAQVRRHIGYMPENNPLYGEMRVNEYLRFRADLKGVPRPRRRGRIQECIESCDLSDVDAQIIHTLSKGYRQRVGLADALLAEPDVLILDEPTIGLDPNQIRRTREMVRQLSDRHTVLLSTHILQEVEALCERVLIIDGGRIVADDSVRDLSREALHGSVRVELRGEPDSLRSELLQIEDVEDVHLEAADDWNLFRVTPVEGRDVRTEIYSLSSRRGWPLRDLTIDRATLEDIFEKFTLSERRSPTARGGDSEEAASE